MSLYYWISVCAFSSFYVFFLFFFFFFSSRRRHTRSYGDWSSDVCSSDLDFADRPIALSYGSRLILERLGAWSSVRSNAIQTIHVSQQGFGRTVMHCSD